MHFIKQKQDNTKLAAVIGFWSAILVAVLNIWFYIAYGLYQSIQLAPWHGLTDYVTSFTPFRYLPGHSLFLISPNFPDHDQLSAYLGRGREEYLEFLAVVFAVIYTTLVSINYYIQMTVVQYNLINGNTDGLSLWLYAYPYPRSFPGAFEGAAYGFMCVSFLFAAQIFSDGKLQRWAHWTFVGTGITGLVVFIDPLFRLPIAFLMVDGIAGAIFLTLAPVLLAIVFRRDINSSRNMDNQIETRSD